MRFSSLSKEKTDPQFHQIFVLSFRDIYHIMAGHTVYHGVAQKVYVAKEAIIGMSLGLVAGAVWKYSHWERRKEIQSYYEKSSLKSSK